MSFNTDGELIGDDPITFEVLPQAIECIVGTPAQGAAAGT
jgi:diacylglycerol kinase family enzyme